MTSITKHQYTSLNGCANKENEAVNGGQNDPVQKKSTNTLESGFDWTRKEAISDRRKLRLAQVRQQSKDIASQIRENVRDAEKRQLDKLNRVRQNELMNWRKKQFGQTEGDLKSCMAHVADAHLEAERENEKMRKIEEQKQKNRKLAQQRGNSAAEKLKSKVAGKKDAVKEKRVVTVATQVADSIDVDSDSSLSLSSGSSICSVILVDDTPKEVTKKKTAKFKLSPKKKPLSPTAKKKSSPKSKSKKQVDDYEPSKFESIISSASATDVSSSSPLFRPPVITRISDMLGKSNKTSTPSATSVDTDPSVRKTYNLISPMKNAKTKAAPIVKPSTSKASSRLSVPMKTQKTKVQVAAKSSVTNSKHFVPEFVKKKPSLTTPSLDHADHEKNSTKSQKVQFYDHANRFSKEYDGNINLSEEVVKVTQLNAWDEAQKEIGREQIHQRQVADARKLDKVRETQALEKEKIRKDYELMSSQLSEIMKDDELAKNFLHANELLSESRLKEIAEEKQQLMNKDFRSILKAPVLITCPKIKPSSQRQNNQMSLTDINVAQPATTSHPHKQKSREIDISSDSSHSFLLDYVTARTNNINDDIDRCRNESIKNKQNQSKIDGLVELLNRVNSLRRILYDEIKQSNGDHRIDADKVINTIDEVEQRQNEIMKGKVATKSTATNTSSGILNRNRERTLTERERILKKKEECIDERARELYLREKKLNPNPVRIVINVNKNGEKIVEPASKDPKWCDRLKKPAEIKEVISTVPVVNRQGKTYPKTPGKVKLPTEPNKACDVSSQSTTVTAYLSPPEHIETKLTKALEGQAAIVKPKKLQKQKENTLRLNLTYCIILYVCLACHAHPLNS